MDAGLIRTEVLYFHFVLKLKKKWISNVSVEVDLLTLLVFLISSLK